MGLLQRTELVSKVRRKLGNRTDFTDSEIIDYLNIAQYRLARVHPGSGWRELDRLFETTFSITSDPEDDKFLALPANLKELFSVRVITNDGRSRKLEYMARRMFDAFIPEPEFPVVRHPPTTYTMHNNIMEVWRVPDQAWRVIARITIWPLTLDSDAQKSDLEYKDDILMYLTASMLFDDVGEYEKARRFFGVAERLKDDAIADDIKSPDREVKPVSEYEANPIGNYWQDPWVTRVNESW